MNVSFYQVAPRYSGGSPAMVTESVALRVMADETFARNAALEGVFGEEERRRAQTLGLSGIVERLTDRDEGWDVEDLLTGEQSYRPSQWSLRQQEAREREALRRSRLPVSLRVAEDLENLAESVIQGGMQAVDPDVFAQALTGIAAALRDRQDSR